jgi:translation initiation factor 1
LFPGSARHVTVTASLRPDRDSLPAAALLSSGAARAALGGEMGKRGSWQDGEQSPASGNADESTASRDADQSTSAGDADESPFSALAALREALPPGPAPPASPPAAAPKGPAKAVVRLERKGRGGKDATIVAQLGLPRSELEAWLKALKSQLGCGGAVEDDAIVLQGDLRKRVGPLLQARGVRKVVGG